MLRPTRNLGLIFATRQKRMSGHEPNGPRPKAITAATVAGYAFLGFAAIYFLVPLYVMISNSLKELPEIVYGNAFALPAHPTFAAWGKAWGRACVGLSCDGLQAGFVNSIKITIASLGLSLSVAATSGSALACWPFRGSEFFFRALLIAAFLPNQVIVYPLATFFGWLGVPERLGISRSSTRFSVFRSWSCFFEATSVRSRSIWSGQRGSTAPVSGHSFSDCWCRCPCRSSQWRRLSKSS